MQATWRIFQELRTLYVKHGGSRPIDRIYSEASLGKAHLYDFGITPFMKQNPSSGSWWFHGFFAILRKRYFRCFLVKRIRLRFWFINENSGFATLCVALGRPNRRTQRPG